MNVQEKKRSLLTVRAMLLQEWTRGARHCAERLEIYEEQVKQERRGGRRGRRGTLVDMSSYAASNFWFPAERKLRFALGIATRVVVKTVCDLLGLRWENFITRS